MNKIWDRKSFEVAFVAGMKQPNDHAELTKVERLKKKQKNIIIQNIVLSNFKRFPNINTCRNIYNSNFTSWCVSSYLIFSSITV